MQQRPPGGGQQLDGEPDQDGEQDQIVNISQHWDEVWNEIDGAERISDHKQPKRLGIPGRPGMFSRKPYCHAITLDPLCPAFQCREGVRAKYHHTLAVNDIRRPIALTRAWTLGDTIPG